MSESFILRVDLKKYYDETTFGSRAKAIDIF